VRAEDTWWEEWALAQGLEKKGGGEERGGGGRGGRGSGDEFFPRGEGNNEFFPVGTLEDGEDYDQKQENF